MRRSRNPKVVIQIFFIALIFSSQLAAQAPNLEFQQVLQNKIDVVDVVNAGDGSNRIFLVHQSGNVQGYSQSFNYIGEFLSVPDMNTSGVERGLLSVAFHPDYKHNGYVFVYFTGGPNGDLTLARYKRSTIDSNSVDAASRVVLLTIPKPITFSAPFEPDKSHNGAKLNFGRDGYLYFATGDGGSGYDVYGNAQSGTSLLGKMLRIDVNSETSPYYIVPADNPYINNPNVRSEIWAMGLRNPWRWSFDRLTNDIWLADVGQRDREEINYVPAGMAAGKSFGWHCYEGSIPTPTLPGCVPSNYIAPIFDYSHDGNGGSAVIGGFVYRGSEFPSLNGYYICCDYSSRNVWLIKRNEATSLTEIRPKLQSLPTSVFTFGEAENGTIYASGNDGIFKVAVSSALPVKLTSFTLTQSRNQNLIKWKTAEETNLKEFVLEFSNNGMHFTDAGKIASSGNQNGSTYSFNHSTLNNQRIFYRLRLVDNDGSITYSKIISSLAEKQNESLRVYPTVSSGQRIQLELNATFKSVQVYNTFGQPLYRIDQPGIGMVYLDVSNWKKGTYFLVARNDQDQQKAFFTVQ